jgi:hypothetical protein
MHTGTCITEWGILGTPISVILVSYFQIYSKCDSSEENNFSATVTPLATYY